MQKDGSQLGAYLDSEVLFVMIIIIPNAFRYDEHCSTDFSTSQSINYRFTEIMMGQFLCFVSVFSVQEMIDQNSQLLGDFFLHLKIENDKLSYY